MLVQMLFVAIFALNLLAGWMLRKIKYCKLASEMLFILVPFLTVFYPQPKFELDYFWWYVAGYIAIALGLALYTWAKLSLQGHEGRLYKEKAYYLVRHPQYLGLIFIWVGWWWIWAGVYSFYFGMLILGLVWLQAWLEEQLFGRDYLDYKHVTGMFWIK